MKLNEIVKEIEKVGKQYKTEKEEEIKTACNEYIELLITNEAEKSQQYNLCDYYSRLKR